MVEMHEPVKLDRGFSSAVDFTDQLTTQERNHVDGNVSNKSNMTSDDDDGFGLHSNNGMI